jgi:hypothetical protein
MSNSSVTVIVACHPVSSHPSARMVMQTVESLHNIVGIEPLNCIISHDGVRLLARAKERKKYKEYLKNLASELDTKSSTADRFLIVRKKSRSHLTGNLKNAIKYVKTEFVLVVQHDLMFIKSINLDSYLTLMRLNSNVKHLRFNIRPNTRRGWDAGDKDRYDSFGEVPVKPPICKTLAWSDHNHLTRTDYYKKIVFPLVGPLRTFPESVLNQISSRDTHSIFGTFIAGPLGESAAITHLDGSNSDVVQEEGVRTAFLKVKKRLLWTIFFHVGKLNLKRLKSRA